MAIIIIIVGIAGIVAFAVAAFDSNKARILTALWGISICAFISGIYFLFNVGTDVGMLCSVIVSIMGVIILALTEIARHVMALVSKQDK
jgi:hypothetical protein